MGIVNLGTDVGFSASKLVQSSQNKNFKSITRNKVEIKDLLSRGLRLPEETFSATEIIGTHTNGGVSDFILYKDMNGRNLGSISFFPKGETLEISIERNSVKHSDMPEAINLKRKYFVGENKVYSWTKTVENEPVEERHIFLEMFRMCKSLKNMPETYWSETLNQKKPNDVNKMYFSVVKSKKLSDKTMDVYENEVMQIKTGKKPYKKSIKIFSNIDNEGNVNVKSMNENNVTMNSKNPYFKLILLDTIDMLRGMYMDIVKKRGVKSFEPPLLLEDFSMLFPTSKIKNYLGAVPPNNECILVNTNKNRQPYRDSLVMTLGHECEHAFTQNSLIYRSGLANLKGENSFSIKFFDGLMEHFKPIKKGSAEYKKAVVYNNENLNYGQIVYDESGNINMDKYSSLTIEKEADIAGEKERKTFLRCLNDFKRNFNLINLYYILKA